MEKNIIEVKKMDTIFGENMYELIVGIQNSNGTRMTTTICELSFNNLRDIKEQISDLLLHDCLERGCETVKDKQNVYHNYPIGTIICPCDTSYMKLIHKKDNWDGINQEKTNGGLYHKCCKVVSEEYEELLEDSYNNKFYNFVNVEYHGAVYRVLICEHINMADVEHILEQDIQ